MGCTVDHLHADLRVRVLESFRDARGAHCSAGDRGIIRHLELDWARQEIAIGWERDGKPEQLVFALAAQSGPRNGRMRDFFAAEERVAPPVQARPAVAVALPPLAEELVTDPALMGDALTRIAGLCARRRFDAAEEQIRKVLDGQDPYGGRLQELAGEMVNIAIAHVGEPDRVVFDWASNRAITLWYAWGSGATSGGEGAARMLDISAAEKRLADCQRSHP